jgi:voltage-gated potassium channel
MIKRISFRSLAVALLVVLGVVLLGTIGYIRLANLAPLDALYLTIAYMTTVGDSYFPLPAEARTFSIVIMVLGIGSVLYTFGIVAEYILEGHLGLAIRRQRMQREIATLKNHFVICGFGRVGLHITEELAEARQQFVIVDELDSSIERCKRAGFLYVRGDATSDIVLMEAGIDRARCLLVATDDDSHNISITLSARHISKSLQIIGRANHDETEAKLLIAGADRVLSPYTIAGHRMATLALRPETPYESETVNISPKITTKAP